MAQRLKGAGFLDQDIRLVGPRPEQQNLVVRFRGKGSARLTADEEGGDANGVDWLLRNRRDLIDAEYCINPDGGELQIMYRLMKALASNN